MIRYRHYEEDPAVAGSKRLYPSSTFTQAYLIMDAVAAATKKAEQMEKAGHLPKDERHAFAMSLILETLKEVGIEVTDNVGKIIEGLICMCCMILPHHNEEAYAKEDAE